MTRIIRTTKIDPAFENGFSVGWHFSLPEGCRQELDIRKTERKENGRALLRWTQGPFFCFAEGQIIYDTPKAYRIWSEALGHIGRYCKIISAVPCATGPDDQFLHGQVFFRIRRPNAEGSGVEAVGSYRMTQTDFVWFLKTGKMKTEALS